MKRAGVKKDVRPCICLYIDSIFTWIVTRPCGVTISLRNFVSEGITRGLLEPELLT
jgi:hypothetical protein